MRKYKFSLVDYSADVVRIGNAVCVPFEEKFPIAYDEKGKRLGRISGNWPLIEYNRYGAYYENFPENTPIEVRDTVITIHKNRSYGSSLSNFAIAWEFPDIPQAKSEGGNIFCNHRKHISYYEIVLADSEKFDINNLFLPALYPGSSHFISNSRFIIYNNTWYNSLNHD